MFKLRHAFFAVLVLYSLAASHASASGSRATAGQAPAVRSLSYRGWLEQAGAAPNGSVTLTMSLHPTARADAPALWSTSFPGVAVEAGRFGVVLGDAGNPLPDSIFESGQVFLRIAVNGVALREAQPLSVAPFAQRAESADYALHTEGDLPVGAVMMHAGPGLPAGWLFCNGAQYARADFPALYAVLQTTFGADSEDTFAVPDLRGRVPMGTDPKRAIGARLGEDRHYLTSAELPVHTHTYVMADRTNGYPDGGGDGGGSWGYWRFINSNAVMNADMVSPIYPLDSRVWAQSDAYPVAQPSVVVNYIIKY